MILANAVPGFRVENNDLPPTHPLHPANKAGVLFKAGKPPKLNFRRNKKKHGVRGREAHITIDQTIHTKPIKPYGSD